jgi:hypothetical protein
MEKLYFLIPNAEGVRSTVDELLQLGIDWEHIHLVANQDTPLEDLPDATPLETSDFVPSLKRGVSVGGATGLLAGLGALALPSVGLVVGGGAMLAGALGGAGFGAWASAMIGSSVPNSHIRQFEKAIKEGQILMLVEVAENRIDETQQRIRKHHPTVKIEGVEPTLPPAV